MELADEDIKSYKYTSYVQEGRRKHDSCETSRNEKYNI